MDGMIDLRKKSVTSYPMSIHREENQHEIALKRLKWTEIKKLEDKKSASWAPHAPR